MTVLNIFIYRQLLKYFDAQEEDSKAERRCHAVIHFIWYLCFSKYFRYGEIEALLV